MVIQHILRYSLNTDDIVHCELQGIILVPYIHMFVFNKIVLAAGIDDAVELASLLRPEA